MPTFSAKAENGKLHGRTKHTVISHGVTIRDAYSNNSNSN